MNKEILATFLTLIPKVPDAMDLIESRPIYLVGYVYKLLSKILTNRLKKVLYRSLSRGNKQIFFDGVLIANELIHAKKQELSSK